MKNPAYAGQEDEYDFVICDKLNQCLRIITPQGEVSLFAGRGSSSLNNNPWGYIDGRPFAGSPLRPPERIGL